MMDILHPERSFGASVEDYIMFGLAGTGKVRPTDIDQG
jgi:hypothetical protein